MLRQLGAVLLDSLRLLKSRHLFRLTMTLSTIAAVALFATYSFNAQGIRFLWFDTWENPLVRKDLPGSRAFVAYIFNDVYVRFWLSWGAMILAVVSTASILPDFLSSGAIELSLAKPIGRTRLLAYRVLGALLFVALQAAVGVGLAYLVIGLKFNMWIGGILWAIPLLILQFAYLYSFSTLLAVTTRSTLACVIGTILLWFFTFLVQFSAESLDEIVEQSRSRIRQNEERIARLEKPRSESETVEERRERNSFQISRARERIKDAERDVKNFAPYAQWLNLTELLVPKTGDLRKIMANQAKAPTGGDFFSLLAAGGNDFRPPSVDEEEWDELQRAGREAENELRDVNLVRSIGSSLVVVGAIYLVSAWIFARRDF